MHKRIELVRKHLGLTKKDFSHQLGITEQAYINYSKGTRVIPTELAIKIKRMFDISLDWLLSGEEKPSSNESYIEEISKKLPKLNQKQLKFINGYIDTELTEL